jgi:hypothetical protein
VVIGFMFKSFCALRSVSMPIHPAGSSATGFAAQRLHNFWLLADHGF